MNFQVCLTDVEFRITFNMNKAQQDLYHALHNVAEDIVQYILVKDRLGVVVQSMSHEGKQARKELERKLDAVILTADNYLSFAIEWWTDEIDKATGILQDTLMDGLQSGSWNKTRKWCVKELKKLKIDSVNELPEIMQVMDTVAKQWKIK